MSCLTKLSLAIEYRSLDTDLVAEFYGPCMQVSCRFDRAVGYFTSAALAAAADGIAGFIERGGTIRVVTSPNLTEADVEAVMRGMRSRDEALTDSLVRELNILQALDKYPVDCLAWLVASGILDLKVAVRWRNGALSRGIYHEKIGIFWDQCDHGVAFAGSLNETEFALLENFEGIDVFSSWSDPEQRFTSKANAFSMLWRNKTPGLEIVTLPEAVRRELLNRAPSLSPFLRPKVHTPGKRLRAYQELAVHSWRANDCHGILEMATGTGKTFTATACREVWMESQQFPSLTVVLVPYQHLVRQWASEFDHTKTPVLECHSGAPGWQRALKMWSLAPLRPRVAIATYDTARSTKFRETVSLFDVSMLIADEVHHITPRSLSAICLETYKARLGLSATPVRYFDERGTERLYEYFGGVVFKYDLRKAIADGVLTPYYYHPVIVHLIDDEQQQYDTLSKQISTRVASLGGLDDDDEPLQAMLQRRAQILDNAVAKEDALSAELCKAGRLQHFLVYVPLGQSQRYAELVGRNYKIHRFTADEGPSERASLLRDFDSGNLDGLVAMRCLDEGVDVPSTRTAFIVASTGNPKEFVQRRGRVLRAYEGKDFADIFDFIAFPAKDNRSPWDAGLIEGELRRIRELSELAINRFQAEALVIHEARRFGVLV